MSEHASDPRWREDLRDYVLEGLSPVTRVGAAVASQLFNKEEHEIVFLVLDIHFYGWVSHRLVIGDGLIRLFGGLWLRGLRVVVFGSWWLLARCRLPRLGRSRGVDWTRSF